VVLPHLFSRSKHRHEKKEKRKEEISWANLDLERKKKKNLKTLIGGEEGSMQQSAKKGR